MAKVLSISGMLVGAIGIFLGFYYLDENVNQSIQIVTLTTVGLAGVIAFVRHVIFYKQDMKRLGWETDRPDWMFEVGFANLAFGFMGIISVLLKLNIELLSIIILGYALYLLQAAILHAYRYFTDENKSPSRLWRSVIATLLYVIMMTYFGVYAF